MHRRPKAVLITAVVMLAAACSAAPAPTPQIVYVTPAPTASPAATPMPSVPPTPSPTATPIPSGSELAALLLPPTASCEDEVADSMMCTDGKWTIYLEFHASAAEAQDAWSGEFVQEDGTPWCSADLEVQGSYEVNGVPAGSVGGCGDSNWLTWTVDAMGVEATVFGGDLDTYNAPLGWFTSVRPVGDRTAMLTGTGLVAPAVPSPTPTPRITYETLSKRAWAKVVKSPDSYIDRGFVVWACISQFDSATGTDTFRAQASYRKLTYWYSDGDNAIFTGDEAQLLDFLADDVVVMKVLVTGSWSYETTSGGTLTVPAFEIQTIQRKGSC